MNLENNVPFGFTVSCRISNLKFMNYMITEFYGDEDLIEPWLMYGVPDEASEDDYDFIARDIENYNEVIELFSKLCQKLGD